MRGNRHFSDTMPEHLLHDAIRRKLLYYPTVGPEHQEMGFRSQTKEKKSFGL
jgi:hypothetical protein